MIKSIMILFFCFSIISESKCSTYIEDSEDVEKNFFRVKSYEIHNPVTSLKNKEDGNLFLDEIHDNLKNYPNLTSETFIKLIIGLSKLRLSLSAEDWKKFAKASSQHPVRGIIHQDPFTKRAYDKPRGYAGDAIMLDYVYRHYHNDISCQDI